MRVYVFIDSPPESAREVVARLRDKQCVLVADVVNGPHPVVAVLEDPDPSAIAKTVLFDIRRIDEVRDVTAYLALESHQEKAIHEGEIVKETGR